MTERRRTWLKRLLILPPVALGIAVLALQLSGRSAPDQAAPQEIARPVRVITVEPTDVVPRALGYGHVEPGRVWQAVAQVGGQVVEMHPLLDRGQLIPAGETVLRIDPSDYELAIAQIEADLESLDAELAQIEVEQANTETLVEIGERALELAESELQRARRLRANGNISQAAVDQAANAVLTQRERLQQQLNRLALIPAERRLLEARRAQYEARLSGARLELERTEIRMPFDGRIAEVNVEEAQFASVGQVLVVADGIAVAEVNAQVAIDRMRPLVEGEALDLATLSAAELRDVPERFGLTAVVRLRTGDMISTWDARFDRLSDMIDPQTRTVGVIVTVDEPYRQAIPGVRPPLAKNMFVEVELRAPPRPDRIVVPRVAVHAGPDGGRVVYVADAAGRLRFRPITLGPAQGDFAIVREGLAPGDQVVVSDLIPAIEGMLLAPSPDDALAEQLYAAANGVAGAEVPIR